MTKSASKKHGRSTEFGFAVGFVFLIVIFSAANLFQDNKDGQTFPTGYVVIPGTSGIYNGVDETDLTYVNFEEEVMAADQDIVLRLDTHAWEGEYLAYELDGKYVADVVVQRQTSSFEGTGIHSNDPQTRQKEFVQFLLNLDRGLHEISVYVLADGKVY